MPGQFFGELLLRPIFEFVLHVLSYGTGYFLLDTFSWGKIKMAPLAGSAGKKRGRSRRRGKGKKQGKELSVEVTCVVGLVFWLGILIGAILIAGRGDDEAVGEEGIEMIESASD